VFLRLDICDEANFKPGADFRARMNFRSTGRIRPLVFKLLFKRKKQPISGLERSLGG
jgi:hypothetical protein